MLRLSFSLLLLAGCSGLQDTPKKQGSRECFSAKNIKKALLQGGEKLDYKGEYFDLFHNIPKELIASLEIKEGKRLPNKPSTKSKDHVLLTCEYDLYNPKDPSQTYKVTIQGDKTDAGVKTKPEATCFSPKSVEYALSKRAKIIKWRDRKFRVAYDLGGDLPESVVIREGQRLSDQKILGESGRKLAVCEYDIYSKTEPSRKLGTMRVSGIKILKPADISK